jgi:hypothetical protein
MIKLLSETAHPSTPRLGAGPTGVIIPLKELGDYHCKTKLLPFSTVYNYTPIKLAFTTRNSCYLNHSIMASQSSTTYLITDPNRGTPQL